jgi:hypothetical protein
VNVTAPPPTKVTETSGEKTAVINPSLDSTSHLVQEIASKEYGNIIFRLGCLCIDHSTQRLTLVKEMTGKEYVKIIFRWGCHWIEHSIQRLILVHKFLLKVSI